MDAENFYGMSDAELAARPTVFREGCFEGRTVLVTGGAGGFGRAMTILFLRLGAQAVIAGRTQARLDEAAESILATCGKRPDTIACNIRNPDDCEAAIDSVIDRHGGLDTLINNAGGQFAQNALDFSRKGWLAVIDTNLNGSWWMMQHAARRWQSAGTTGNIINIIIPVERGMPQMAHSAAARAGIVGLTKTVSTEWAPLGIRVNCVAPGSIASDGLHNYDAAAVKRLTRSNPMMTLGDAWDVAEACAYLAGPSGKFVTGEVLTLDGGMRQWGASWPAGIPEPFVAVGGL